MSSSLPLVSLSLSYTSAPQHVGVGRELLLKPQVADPPHPAQDILGKKKMKCGGLLISPRSSSVQPDVSCINVWICLFILVGGLSSLPYHPCPPSQSAPGFQPLGD